MFGILGDAASIVFRKVRKSCGLIPTYQLYSVMNRMEKLIILTLRIDSGLKEKLDRLAKSTQRSRSFLAAEAIREYVSLNEWQIEEIQKGIQEANAGNFATTEEVEETFKKWAKRAR